MKHSWGDGTTYWKDEQMTAIVERLRDPNLAMTRNEAAEEIERLEHMKANLHSHIKRLEGVNKKLEQENAKLREALAWLVMLKDITKQKDREMYEATKEVAWAEARAALQKDATPRCHAGRDGECNWKHCPQERDGEPARTGRHCPLDVEEDEE